MNKNDLPPAVEIAETAGMQAQIDNKTIKDKSDLRARIALRLRSCRYNDKMTQEDVAKAIDVNHLTYRGYENCKSDIPILYLVRLANLFNVSLDYLTGRIDTKNHANSTDTATRLDQLEQLVAKLTQDK